MGLVGVLGKRLLQEGIYLLDLLFRHLLNLVMKANNKEELQAKQMKASCCLLSTINMAYAPIRLR